MDSWPNSSVSGTHEGQKVLVLIFLLSHLDCPHHKPSDFDKEILAFTSKLGILTIRILLYSSLPMKWLSHESS